jgi:predicted transcriptional regulator
MEVSLTPEQQAHLAELATRKGCSTNELVQEALTRYLDEEARFAEAVKLGLDAADRSEFVSSDEVWAAVERTLQS